MVKIIFCWLMVFSIHFAFAQTEIPESTLPTDPSQAADPSTPPITEPTTEPTIVPQQKKLTSQVLRGLTRYTANLHFSPFSTWIPWKYGISGGYVFSDRWTLEAEYTHGQVSASFYAVDFGKIVDRRFGLQSRWFPNSNSFNVILGFYKSEFYAEVGSSVLNNITGTPEANVLSFESFGPQFGLSNRWQWESGFSFGVDWLVMYVPAFGKSDDNVLKYVSNSSDRSDLDKIAGLVRNIPQFDLLKFNLGYNF